MNVFILTSGRSGSVSFSHACEFISNYSIGHESKADVLNQHRVEFPSNHIEVDNRLIWFTGLLDQKYGKEAFYVYLVRDKKKTASSFIPRIYSHTSILRAFASGILKTPYHRVNKNEWSTLSQFFLTTIDTNIELFLKDKPNKLTVRLENIENDFRVFWESINAQGDLEGAIRSFSSRKNTRGEFRESIAYRLKSFFSQQLFHLRRAIK